MMKKNTGKEGSAVILESLRLHNFRCYETLDMTFHPRLTIIVGTNGAGKTSVLEGIAVAVSTLFTAMDGIRSLPIGREYARLQSFAMGSTFDVQAQYPVEVAATAQNEGKLLHWKRSLNRADGSTTTKDAREMVRLSEEYQRRLREGDESLILPVLAYYGTGRLWDDHREKRGEAHQTSTRTNGYLDSVDGTANIKLMLGWFRRMTVQKYQNQELGIGPVPELEAVYRAMEDCYQRITHCETVKVQYNMNTNALDILTVDERGERMRMPLSQLSDGYRCTISLVADIAYRMATLNPQLLDEVCRRTGGIILIDEIDLHLHPAWQQRILEDLLAIFPQVQFVVTTHAPVVVSSAKSENLFLLKDAQPLGILSQSYGNDANSILDEIMGVSPRHPAVAEQFQRFEKLLEEKRYEEAEKLLDELDALRGYHDKEVSSGRVKLRLERIRGGKK